MKENINEIVAYIRANVDKRIKVEDVANTFGYSKFHFSREFKKWTGFSANEFISALKMEKSISLLVKNRKNVLCSHLNAGFLSSTTFTASFEKQTGMKPKKYQKQLLELFEVLQKYEKLEFAEESHYDYLDSHRDCVDTQEESEASSASFNCKESLGASSVSLNCKESLGASSVYFNCKDEVQNHSSFSKCIVNLNFPEGYRSGICFVGLFHAPIPNHRPIVGKAMVGSNLCILDRIPEGTFYLLACSIEKNSPTQRYFVLDDCHGNYLMGYDVQESDFRRNKVQDTIVSLEIESNEELDRIFKELSEGGESLQEPSNQAWGYYAVVIDQFGVEWELMNSDECQI